MAITKTWEVNTLERELADGYVKKVIYRVKGMDGSEENLRATGEVELEKPETLIPYKDLTEAKVLDVEPEIIETEEDGESSEEDAAESSEGQEEADE